MARRALRTGTSAARSVLQTGAFFAATYPGSINFMRCAGLVWTPCDLNSEADPQAALRAIIHGNFGPALIHVRIDAEEKEMYPMVPPGWQIQRWWGISHAETIAY